MATVEEAGEGGGGGNLLINHLVSSKKKEFNEVSANRLSSSARRLASSRAWAFSSRYDLYRNTTSVVWKEIEGGG